MLVNMLIMELKVYTTVFFIWSTLKIKCMHKPIIWITKQEPTLMQTLTFRWTNRKLNIYIPDERYLLLAISHVIN